MGVLRAGRAWGLHKVKKPLEVALRDLLARYADLSRWERIVALEHVLRDERDADDMAKTEQQNVTFARDILLEAGLM